MIFRLNKPLSFTQNGEKAYDSQATLGRDYFSGQNIPLNSIIKDQNINGDFTNYTSPVYGFSFVHSKGFKVGAFAQGEGNVVLLQNSQGKGIQIYVSPIGEDIAITPERIKQDIPDMVINEPKQVRVSGVTALAFKSPDVSLGSLRQVWLVYKKNLYQITASSDLDSDLARILISWKWGQ